MKEECYQIPFKILNVHRNCAHHLRRLSNTLDSTIVVIEFKPYNGSGFGMVDVELESNSERKMYEAFNRLTWVGLMYQNLSPN